MDFVEILIKSLVIGGLIGFAVGAGAARMFRAPQTQGMGAFRTLGELNACEGDPIAHYFLRTWILVQLVGVDCRSGRIYTGRGASHHPQLGGGIAACTQSKY